MKAGRPNLLWIILALVIVVVAAIVFLLRPDNRGPKLVAETRQALRTEGFKTDLADFDFSTSAELQQREAALQALGRVPAGLRNAPNIMEAVNNNSAVIVWKQDSLQSRRPPGNEMSWDEFREQVDEHQSAVDAAWEPILSSPIRFNLIATNGSALLLPHVGILRGLADALCNRAILELHDGNKDAAWTNLMAATRLVTAWEPEPVEISYRVRYVNTREVFNTTWQALQADGWSDVQLARLQQEWAGVDFFTNLSEIAAFKLASDADQAARSRDMSLKSRPSFFRFAIQLLQAPRNISVNIRDRRNESEYLHHGWYEDQKDLMLYNRDRVVQLRKTVQSPTWAQMRQLLDDTNQVPFQSKFPRSYMQVFVSMPLLPGAPSMRHGGLPVLAAEAEADRRILLTAIALERYRGKHGSYPSTLAPLAPDFLKTVPVDFMDGQPLRYRLRDDGHFLLYSVGLDCVDDGGRISLATRPRPGSPLPADVNGVPSGDIVWPFPASAAAIDAQHQQELAALRSEAIEADDLQATQQWERTARHQDGIEKLLAAPPVDPPDPSFHGRPVSEVLCNTNSTGTNQLTLGQMLTLRQILTGQEPETITFELPVNYNVLTNLGVIELLIDANNDHSDEDCNVQQAELNQATNGDCLLAWSTLYESPGKHALAARLFLEEGTPDSVVVTGPLAAPFTVTNICQFGVGSAHFDPRIGAIFRAKLPEANGNYFAQLTATNGTVLKTFTGRTTNGVFNFFWDLTDEHGQRLTNDSFNSVFHITLPDSGRSQILRGP
jgi:hypothetical protein